MSPVPKLKWENGYQVQGFQGKSIVIKRGASRVVMDNPLELKVGDNISVLFDLNVGIGLALGIYSPNNKEYASTTRIKSERFSDYQLRRIQKKLEQGPSQLSA